MQQITPTEFMWIVLRDAEVCGAALDEDGAIDVAADLIDVDDKRCYSIHEVACWGGRH